MTNCSYWLVCVDLCSSHQDFAEYSFSDRFRDDKCFFEDEYFLLICDGVLLNKKDLFRSNSCTSMKDLLFQILFGETTVERWTGVFTGFVYDKTKRKGYAWGNQTGDVSCFYSFDEKNKKLFVSNNFNILIERVGCGALDEKTSHFLLTYGFVPDDGTISCNIKRINPGCLLHLMGTGFRLKKYHRFTWSKSVDMTMEQAVEGLDHHFRKAVRLCFEKDIEYGYKRHLADLSAGLDSRMVNWIACDLAYKDITNISYSQSQTDEYCFSAQMGERFLNEFFHHSLDDATFLYDIDEMVKLQFSLGCYYSISGGYQWLRFINFCNYGLEHTGQLGDVIVGSYLHNEVQTVNLNAGRYSSLLPLRFHVQQEDYKCHEDFMMYTRGFKGILNTHYLRNNFTYAVSPFLDLEFMEFCASIPLKLRLDSKLYWKWLDTKYPVAASFPSSRMRNDRKVISFLHKLKNKVSYELYDLGYKLGLLKSSVNRNHMNPYQYWYETNEHLRNFICDYFDENIHIVGDYPELYKEACTMYNSNNAINKLMAISLLATVKTYIK